MYMRIVIIANSPTTQTKSLLLYSPQVTPKPHRYLTNKNITTAHLQSRVANMVKHVYSVLTSADQYDTLDNQDYYKRTYMCTYIHNAKSCFSKLHIWLLQLHNYPSYANSKNAVLTKHPVAG